MKSRSVSLVDLVDGLPGVVGEDLVETFAQPHDVLGVDVDVRGLALETGHQRLVQQHPAVRQREAFALGAPREKHCAHRRRLAEGDGRRRRV